MQICRNVCKVIGMFGLRGSLGVRWKTTASSRGVVPYHPPMHDDDAGTGPSARTRLLDAGLTMLGQGGRTLLRRLITADDVSRRAGVSRRTFYDNFETTDDYVDSLHTYLLDVDTSGSGDGRVVSNVRDGVEHLLAVAAGERAAAVRLFRAVQGSPNPESMDGGALAAAVADFMELLKVRGRPLRPDVERGLARGILTAFIDGIALALDLRTSDESRAQVVDAVLRFVAVVTEDSSVGTVHRDPAVGLLDAVADSEAVSEVSAAPQHLRAMVLDRAAEEFRMRGYHAATLDRIALRSGVSESTVSHLFGTTLDLARAVVDRLVPLPDPGGLAAVVDPLGTVGSILGAVIGAVQEAPPIGEVLLAADTCQASAGASMMPGARLAGLLTDAGVTSRFATGEVLARTALTMAVAMATTQPDVDPGVLSNVVMSAVTPL